MWISIITTILIRIPVAYGIAAITKTPEFPHGKPDALFLSLMISWTIGMIISIVAYLVGGWKRRMYAARKA